MENIERDVVLELTDIIRDKRSRVIFITGLDDETNSAFLGLLKRLTVKALKKEHGEVPFDHVLIITSTRLPSVAIGRSYRQSKEQLMIAEALGVCEEEDYKFLSDQDYQNSEFHQYLDDDDVERLVILPKLAAKIHAKLVGKSYLLVFDGLERPITQDQWISMGLSFPDMWSKSWWLISVAHVRVFRNSRFGTDLLITGYELMAQAYNLLLLEASDILSSLFPAYYGAMDPNDVVNCLMYCRLFSSSKRKTYRGGIVGIREEELVKHWIEAGMLNKLTASTVKMTADERQEEHVEDEEVKASLLFDTGKVLLDMFLSRSLLRHSQLGSCVVPTSWTWSWMEARRWMEARSHASFMTFTTIKVEKITNSELTTLVLRGWSLDDVPDDLFQYTPCLTVLDLSYTNLTFLPSSVFHLKNLRLLSLKGCESLTTLASYSPIHALHSLHVLDVSYTKIVSLPPTLYMPCLTDLLLDGCTSLLNPPPFLESLNNLRVLRLTDSQITAFPESTFSRMERLRVLDLSRNRHLISLPESLSKAIRLKELHMDSCKALKKINAIGSAMLRSFSLSDNDGLESLPESLSQIAGLEEMHLHDCRALRRIDAICGNKLKILSLDNLNYLTSLPNSFSKLDSLEELHIRDCRSLMNIEGVGNAKLKVFFLSNNDHLMLLPESFREARNLEELHLKDCRALKDIKAIDGTKLKIFTLWNNDNLTSLPEWFSKANDLQKLHLQKCRAMKEMNLAGNVSLRSLFLSGSPVVRLSIRGCKNLESIELLDLEELEFLDLSFTHISELPAEIFGLPKLRHFEMVAAQQLKRFPWHHIQQLPNEFIFDHCSCHGNVTLDGNAIDERKIQQCDDGNIIRASIFVDDPRFFYSFTEVACRRLVRNVQHLQFDITISPCDPGCKKISSTRKEEVGASGCRFIGREENFPYKDTYFMDTDHPNCRLYRHLTMIDNDRFPTSGKLQHLFDVVESLSISDDTSVKSLSVISTMNSLKKCVLKECHDMECVFGAVNSMLQQRSLEILCVSKLPKLTTLFFAGRQIFFATRREFGSLKHLHIEHCLRLEKLFPSHEDLLPSLETLTIKFCDGLREIVYKHQRVDETIYPRLHTVILLELPKLQHFREDLEANMPSLKTLHVRGCWRLRRIPLLGRVPENQDQVTEVSGELHWWNKLTWEHYDEYGLDRTSCIRFKPRPDFASSKPTVRGRTRRRANKPLQVLPS